MGTIFRDDKLLQLWLGGVKNFVVVIARIGSGGRMNVHGQLWGSAAVWSWNLRDSL